MWGDKPKAEASGSLREAQAKLDKQWADLNKAIKMATKLYDSAEILPAQSGKFPSLLESLRSALKEASIHISDVDYIVKFKCSKDGADFSLPLVRTVTATSVSTLQNLIDSCKALRACMPKKAVEE